MLLAEIRGKRTASIADNEDYLTSAVFGHLRYIPPKTFWADFFSAAKSYRVDGTETTLGQVLTENEFSIQAFTDLKAFFWPKHSVLGEPDLLLCFSGGGCQPLAVMVEVKLGATKGGSHTNDQLVQYLRILEDKNWFRQFVENEPQAYLLYLTPRESVKEIHHDLPPYFIPL